MEQLNKWIALTVAGMLVVVTAGWLLLISPRRGEAAELRVEAGEQLARNATLRTQIQILEAQARDLPAKKAQLASVAAKIPSTPALPELIRALTAAAAGSSVSLVSLVPSPPAPGLSPGSTSAVTPSTAGGAVTPGATSPAGTAGVGTAAAGVPD